MEVVRNTYRLTLKHLKRRPKYRWEDKIQLDLKEWSVRAQERGGAVFLCLF
jgi:hypothetical protein